MHVKEFKFKIWIYESSSTKYDIYSGELEILIFLKAVIMSK